MNPVGVRRVVLYARISVSKEESVSVERQLAAGRKLAEARGWKVIGEFTDDGVSATANRPEDRNGWKALLAAAGFDAVIIWKVDRLARKVLDFLHVDAVLQARGAGLIAVEDPIDMTTPMGRAFATILAVFGEMEAEAIRARVRAARAHLLTEGRWPGGGIPYGYMSAPNPAGAGRILVKDPERIGWLREITGMALRGETVNAIARRLTAGGAPLPSRSQPGGAWNRQTVDGLLRNPVLAGMTPRNPGRARSAKRADPLAVVRGTDGEAVVDESLALITVTEFAALQEVLASRDSPQARKAGERQATSPFLSKVARCDECDVYMCRGTNQKKPVLYCPRCRQTQGRDALDPYLARRLLRERGTQPLGTATVREHWRRAGADDDARREVLLSQLGTLRIRRGTAGVRFDKSRILLSWREPARREMEMAS
jgi:DNA invertase Pin-like site-specific DNA recombinase